MSIWLASDKAEKQELDEMGKLEVSGNANISKNKIRTFSINYEAVC